MVWGVDRRSRERGLKGGSKRGSDCSWVGEWIEGVVVRFGLGFFLAVGYGSIWLWFVSFFFFFFPFFLVVVGGDLVPLLLIFFLVQWWMGFFFFPFFLAMVGSDLFRLLLIFFVSDGGCGG